MLAVSRGQSHAVRAVRIVTHGTMTVPDESVESDMDVVVRQKPPAGRGREFNRRAICSASTPAKDSELGVPRLRRSAPRVGTARCAVRAAFSGATRAFDCRGLQKFRPLNAAGDAAARRPYPNCTLPGGP